MTSDPVILAWHEAAADLGIDIVAPFEIALDDGTREVFSVLVRPFGRRLGILVDSSLTSSDRFWKRSAIADAAGYSYSQLSPEVYSTYTRSIFVKTLVDWGWAEPKAAPPEWYREAASKEA
jgi:hypothetical protein